MLIAHTDAAQPASTGSFEADTAFIACQTAADFKGAMSLRQPPSETPSPDASEPVVRKAKSTRGRVNVEVALADVDFQARLSEQVCWAAGFAKARAVLPSQSGSISGLTFSLNQTGGDNH